MKVKLPLARADSDGRATPVVQRITLFVAVGVGLQWHKLFMW